MKVIETSLPGVLILEPEVFGDERGFFFESYNKKALEKIGITAEFVQDNHSRSVRNVLRGLHYQIKQPQGKLVRVIQGEVFDVAVDIRRNSPNFVSGWALTSRQKKNAWLDSPGFAHVSWCSRMLPSFFTRRQITGRRSTNAASAGMTLTSRSTAATG